MPSPVHAVWVGIADPASGFGQLDSAEISLAVSNEFSAPVTLEVRFTLAGALADSSLPAQVHSLATDATSVIVVDVADFGTSLLGLTAPAMLRGVIDTYDLQGGPVERAFTPVIYVRQENLAPVMPHIVTIFYGDIARRERFARGDLAAWRNYLLETYTEPPSDPLSLTFEDLPLVPVPGGRDVRGHARVQTWPVVPQ
jgi:hypothetical protein